ncbi:MAG: hypothetical protein SFZ24_12525 [Planctomycetota bacterium]|nr:hypothetical protein [Planctomycetota bacterium]
MTTTDPTPAPPAPPAPAADDFYVGYLALPRSHARFIRILVPIALWSMVALAALVTLTQRPAGAGLWDLSQLRTWEGVLRARPYPMLEIEQDGARRTILLVEQGKHGVRPTAANLDGSRVRVMGWLLERDSRQMIELAPEPESLVALSPAAPGSTRTAPPVPAAAPIELRGEILDFKCYLGAMKPGSGRAHRACAILCVRGGVPPMLVVRTPAGPQFHLLMDDAGGPAPPDILSMIGVPVTVTGRPALIGDLPALAIAPGAVRPAE